MVSTSETKSKKPPDEGGGGGVGDELQAIYYRLKACSPSTSSPQPPSEECLKWVDALMSRIWSSESPASSESKHRLLVDFSAQAHIFRLFMASLAPLIEEQKKQGEGSHSEAVSEFLLRGPGARMLLFLAAAANEEGSSVMPLENFSFLHLLTSVSASGHAS